VRRKLTYDAIVYTEDGHYFAEDNNGHVFCQDSPTACIQEAINYVLSKPTGGRVYIRAGDYYLAPVTSVNCYGQSVAVCVTIPYNEALIVEGDGDATRLHLPQNTLSQQSWLFGWSWNGTAPYTRKSKLRSIAFINDTNTGSYAMNPFWANPISNATSGLEIDSVSVYDIQGTALDFTFWINGMYDVTFSRYRFFSVNSNTPNVAVLFDSVTLGKIVDSFIFSKNGGGSAISNGTGSIQVDSTEIYGPWGSVFGFGNTDGASSIQVSNSIIEMIRSGTEAIQGYSYGNSDFLISNSGNGTVRFTADNSYINTGTYAIYLANGASYPAYILIRNSLLTMAQTVWNPGSGFIYIELTGNEIAGTLLHDIQTNTGGVTTANAYIRITKNIFYQTVGVNQVIQYPTSNETLEVEDNEIYLTQPNNGSQFIWIGNGSTGGLVKFINNDVYFTYTPSSATSYYLVYTPNGSGTYYMPNIIMKGNRFNFPTSNATFGGFVGSAGATVANPSALFVDLNNTFNLSGINLPYPSISTPSVPSSGTAQSNTYPYPVEVYVSGGSATAVQITRGGVTYTVWSSSTATAIPPLLVRLEPGDSITITYSTAPSWTWVPARYIS
jgi:hypothetical protein